MMNRKSFWKMKRNSVYRHISTVLVNQQRFSENYADTTGVQTNDIGKRDDPYNHRTVIS